jgi:hypothetical protein
MARLHTGTAWERLLVPPFVFFFALLYPMRWVNAAKSRVAAAAGGCILVRRDALEAVGGFGAIRGAVIDDVALAGVVKRSGLPIRLATSTGTVSSIREYRSLGGFWRTVRRTAFTQLRHSWLLLVVTIALLAAMFAGPLIVIAVGAGAGAGAGSWLAIVLGAGALATAIASYVPTVRLYGLAPLWALTLPLAGVLYGAMTVDSAVRHARGARGRW